MVLVGFGACCLYAQTFGEVTGRVTDPSGAVIPGAVLNHPSWGAPSGNILAGAAFPGASANAAHQGFGVINTTSIPMRQLQLALKYSF